MSIINIINESFDKKAPKIKCTHSSFLTESVNSTPKRALKEGVNADVIELLANELGISPGEITNSYGNTYETSDGEEYLILDSEGARDAVMNDITNLFDDIGISGFTPDFKDWVIENAIDVSWFEYALDDMNDQYVYDIQSEDSDEFENRFIEEAYDKGLLTDDDFGVDEDGNADYMSLNSDVDLDDIEEQFKDALKEDAGDPVLYFIDNFGDTEFVEVIKQNNLADFETIADEGIAWDGVAHFIASYDGKEIELNDEYSAYRIN